MARLVLVHGNPETSAIWELMIPMLDATDVVTLSPPGFGAPVPDGFDPTWDGYVAWLVHELERFGGDVDLVGHDWGGGHVIRVAVERPDLIRSWAFDIAGCMAPDYVWHDMAQLWQTPGAGEDAVAGLTALSTEDRAAMLETAGMTLESARAVAPHVDEAMGRCILALYRSAAQPALATFSARLGKAKARPGLVIIASEDGYTGGEQRARWTAEQSGAEVAVLDGLGHWWMAHDPKRGAAVLNEFLSGLA